MDVILVLPMFVDSDDGHCGLVYFVLPMMVNILYRKLQICSIACLGESFFFLLGESLVPFNFHFLLNAKGFSSRSKIKRWSVVTIGVNAAS